MSSGDSKAQNVRRIRDPREPRRRVLFVSAAFVLIVCLPSTPISAQTRSTVLLLPQSHAWTSSLGADLGPTQVSRITFPMLLHSAARPSCLQSWAHGAGLTVSWSIGQQWVLVSGAPASIDRNLDVSIDNYRSSDGRIIYSANKRPANPANV